MSELCKDILQCTQGSADQEVRSRNVCSLFQTTSQGEEEQDAATGTTTTAGITAG